MIAAELGHQEMVAALLQAGAAPERRDRDGKTAFDLASATTRGSLPTPR
jgi:ankyrin repeat protein